MLPARDAKPKSVSVHQLKPGDIIILQVSGSPHASIYSPMPGRVGDLIQMGYGCKRSGVIKSTLTRQVRELNRNNDIPVIRSRRLDGAAIAAQAEFWLRQGVVFDEIRLANSLYNYNFPGMLARPSPELNILTYLKFAARRETQPVKSNVYPFNYSSIFTLFGMAFITPAFVLCHLLALLGMMLIRFGTSRPAYRPKGLTCAGFVLACVAAVALRDEINPVSDRSGWVSLKYSNLPALTDASPDYVRTVRQVQGEIRASNRHQPGLHDLMTEEQLRNFDLQRIAAKLTPLLVNQNPHQPSADEFMRHLTQDPDNWEFLGNLDKTNLKEEFDKQVYRDEIQEIAQHVRTNRNRFFGEFGPSLARRQQQQQQPQPQPQAVAADSISQQLMQAEEPGSSPASSVGLRHPSQSISRLCG